MAKQTDELGRALQVLAARRDFSLALRDPLATDRAVLGHAERRRGPAALLGQHPHNGRNNIARLLNDHVVP